MLSDSGCLLTLIYLLQEPMHSEETSSCLLVWQWNSLCCMHQAEPVADVVALEGSWGLRTG